MVPELIERERAALLSLRRKSTWEATTILSFPCLSGTVITFLRF